MKKIKNILKTEKKLLVNVGLFVVSLVLCFYTKTLAMFAKDKARPFGDILYDAAYCKYLDGKISSKFILTILIIILVAYIVLLVINFIKKKHLLKRILLGLILSMILCASAYASVSKCPEIYNSVEYRIIQSK